MFELGEIVCYTKQKFYVFKIVGINGNRYNIKQMFSPKSKTIMNVESKFLRK